MPAALAALIAGLAGATTHIVGRVLVALGVGYVVYSGLDVMLDFVIEQVEGALGGVALISDFAVPILATAQIDTAVELVLSGYSARLVIMGLQNGALTKWILK